jgi:hypothetical protein
MAEALRDTVDVTSVPKILQSLHSRLQKPRRRGQRGGGARDGLSARTSAAIKPRRRSTFKLLKYPYIFHSGNKIETGNKRSELG